MGSNRLKLLEILKFSDFQIFFFTHDKELFELYRNKLVWDAYELYVDDSEIISPTQGSERQTYNELDLAGLVGKSIAASTGEARQVLEKLDSDRKHILNPLSHDDARAIFSQEIKTAIADLEKLKALLK